MGAISPVRWQRWQCCCRMGRTLREKVGGVEGGSTELREIAIPIRMAGMANTKLRMNLFRVRPGKTVGRSAGVDQLVDRPVRGSDDRNFLARVTGDKGGFAIR